MDQFGFEMEDRVMTPGGTGTVRYRRMAADYNTVACYSVALDQAIHNPLYTGSLYPADQVHPIGFVNHEGE
jgi:hypothetical protein